MGLDDIRNKVARTPLDPSEMFRDDPFILLRAVRFANRFNLVIDPNIFNAA